jgi:hypothetical protein
MRLAAVWPERTVAISFQLKQLRDTYVTYRGS